MKQFTYFFTMSLLALVFVSDLKAEAASNDPLPSWNEGANKTAILDFISAITKEGGKDFIPLEDRIATFDMDGTLLVEKPIAAVTAFANQYVAKIAKENPSLDIQPYKAVRENDKDYLARNPVDVLNAAGAGILQKDFRNKVTEFGKNAIHERFNKPYGELFFVPMLELVKYLKQNDFLVYIVSGSSQGFVRGMAKEATGLPMRQLIGTQWVVEFQGGGFIRSARFRNLGVAGAGKPQIIHYQIGQKPVFSFGNTSGDQAMFEFALSHKDYRSIALWLDHDDDKREYAYDGHVKAVDGLLSVSMKNDFKKVFAHE